MNLLSGKFVPVRNLQTNDFEWQSLGQVCHGNGQYRVEHPNHYLSTSANLLVAALLQYLVMKNGLKREYWLDAVEGDARQATLSLLGKETENGFNLVGPNAFMQMPADVFDHSKCESINGLFQPIRPRCSGTSKALRLERPYTKICKGCAALGVYTTQAFSGSMAQYWGASILKGSAVYSLKTATTGQSIWLNVLHEEMACDLHPVKSPAWVGNDPTKDGKDADNRLAFEKHLLPSSQLQNLGLSVFPLIRATRLENPKRGAFVCDCCGFQNDESFQGYFMCSERALLAKVSAKTLQTYKESNNGESLQANGLLARCISPQAKHPSIAHVLRTWKTGQEVTQRWQVQGIDAGHSHPAASRPAWVMLSEIIGPNGQKKPLVLEQYLSEPDLQVNIQRGLMIEIFGIQFESKTNATPANIIHAEYGLNTISNQQDEYGFLFIAAKGIADQVTRIIQIWVDSIQKLEWPVQLVNGKLQMSAPETASKRKKAKQHALNDPILARKIKQLWQVSLDQITDTQWSAERAQSPLQWAALKKNMTEQISRAAFQLWRESQSEALTLCDHDLHDLFRLAQADENYFRQMNGEKKKEWVTQKSLEPST